jgi:hypothetical protein
MNIREYLETHDKLIYNNKGCSMMPLLRQDRDLVIVRKKGEERLRRFDVALYMSEPGHYILHRVIKVNEKDYVIRGDNNFFKEYGITDDDITGVLIGYVRKGKQHSVNEFHYKLYARVWNFIYPLRSVWSRRPAFLKKIRFLSKA